MSTKLRTRLSAREKEVSFLLFSLTIRSIQWLVSVMALIGALTVGIVTLQSSSVSASFKVLVPRDPETLPAASKEAVPVKSLGPPSNQGYILVPGTFEETTSQSN